MSKSNDSYKTMTDDELIRLYRSGESEVGEYLVEKYKPIVRVRARELYLAGGDHEDLLQEGMIGLFKAMQSYEESGHASFETYASLLISRQMYSAVQAAQRQKHQVLNQSISINEMEENHEVSDLGLAESPENIVVDSENARDIRQMIEANLSKLEKQVLDLYISGMDYTQIAEVLGRSTKSIDNTLQRIRTKAKDGIALEESCMV